MSAQGIADHEPAFNSRALLISAHADYRREDFVFPRTQSPALREAPWQSRTKPLKSWMEIGVYVLALGLVSTSVLCVLI